MGLVSILKLSLFLLIHSRWSFCTYNYTIDRTLMTNFTDLNVNAFGYYQGLRLNNGDKTYRRHDSNSSYVDLISNTYSYPNYESFIIKLYNESDDRPFSDTMIDAVEVQILPPADRRRFVQVTFSLMTSPTNDCRMNISSKLYSSAPWDFHIDSKGFLVGTVILEDFQKGKLCAIEILDIVPLLIPLTIVSFSFVQVKVIKDSDPPRLDSRFVWRSRASLMYMNQSLRFNSFFAPEFLSGTSLEQEDLIRTVSIFSSSAGVGVFKMGSFVNCHDDNNIPNLNKPNCVLTVRKPRVYKESVFLQLDRGLDIASRFQTVFIIPLMKRFYSNDPFSVSRNVFDLDSFFFDRQIIDDFKHFINATLNRRNSITGILYKDDATILGWSLGDRLNSVFQSCPPTTWISEISEFIKSIDSNHLVILECWDKYLPSLMVPEIDVVLADYDWDFPDAWERASKLLNLIQKPFLVEFLYYQPSFYQTIKKCMLQNLDISGFLTSSLTSRSESDGFYRNRGLFFPGISGAKEMVIMDLIRSISGNESWSNSSQILNYAPRLLSLNKVQDTALKFSWFGVVGAVSYDLYHAVDDGPFVLLASYLSEILLAPEYTIFNLPKPAECKNTTLFYRLYGIGEVTSMRSPPLTFNITLQSKYNSSYIQCIPAGVSTTVTNNYDAGKHVLISYVVISILASFCISAIITLYFIKRNWGKKSIQISKASANDNGMAGSKSTLFHLTDINDPVKKNFASKISVDLSKRPKGNDNSGHSQVIIYFDDDKSASITINLTTSNEAYTLFVPGYLKFDWMLDFKQIKSLGKGATGTVYEAKVLNDSLKSQHGDSNVAVKRMPFVIDDAFLFEVAIHRLISNHKNIVAFFGYFQGPNGMIMELCDGMLSDLIFLNQKKFDQNFMKMETIVAAANDICRGCTHIHKHDIVHFDLKTANVMFKRTADGIICKVADFGYSRLVNTNGSSSRNARLVNGLEMPTEFGFTIRYCAPEIFQSLTKSTDIHCTADHFKCDIYSFGIILYELLNGVKAWSDEGLLLEISDLVLAGKRPRIKDRFLRAKVEHNYSQDIVKMTSLIEKCWHQDPQSRPDFTSIIDSE